MFLVFIKVFLKFFLYFFMLYLVINKGNFMLLFICLSILYFKLCVYDFLCFLFIVVKSVIGLYFFFNI